MRKEKNLEKLEDLWQGAEFLPSQYKPPTLSQDLVQELFLLSKEASQRGIPLHTLWEDKDEHSISLARLMRQQKGRQTRPFLKVGVVKKARTELKDLPAHGQKGGNTAESTPSLSEPETELARHASPSLVDQSTSVELYEDSMSSTFPPINAARKETFPERTPVGSNEGSSPDRKRRREHTGDDDRMSPSTSLTLNDDRKALEEVPIPVASTEGSSPVRKRKREHTENPFQRWLEGIDIQKARCAIHDSVLVTLDRRHQSCLTDLDRFGTERHRIEKEDETLIGDVITDLQRMIKPSRQLVDIQQELQSRLDVVKERVRSQAALQDERDAILSLVPSRLLQIKTMIVLCHIFGGRSVVARRHLDHMEGLQNNFLAQATRLLEGRDNDSS